LGALSVIVTVPCVPGLEGLNFTLIVQLAPGIRIEPQSFRWEKFALATMPVRLSAPSPMFSKVKFFA
jgi:hypothetical protein